MSKRGKRREAPWLRRELSPDDAWTLAQVQLGDVPSVQDFLQHHARGLIDDAGCTIEDALADAAILGAHLFAYVNYELHRRKTFWVDESLAWMLAHTDLDIRGEALRLPFPSSAFAFGDAHTLEVASRFLQGRTSAKIAGQPLSMPTVHLTEIPANAPARGLNATLLFVSPEDHWPFLVSRDVPIHRTTTSTRSCAATSPRRRATTTSTRRRSCSSCSHSSSTPSSTPRRSPSHPSCSQRPWAPVWAPSAVGRPRGGAARELSSQDVFHLPGKIELSALRRVSDTESGRRGTIESRFMVRGHWRRPNPSWADQRLRWIEPYWKGPETAPIVERDYRLEP